MPGSAPLGTEWTAVEARTVALILVEPIFRSATEGYSTKTIGCTAKTFSFVPMRRRAGDGC